MSASTHSGDAPGLRSCLWTTGPMGRPVDIEPVVFPYRVGKVLSVGPSTVARMVFGFGPWSFGPGDDDDERPVDPAGVDPSFGCGWSLEDLLDVEPGPAAMALLGSINPAELDPAGRVRLL